MTVETKNILKCMSKALFVTLTAQVLIVAALMYLMKLFPLI